MTESARIHDIRYRRDETPPAGRRRSVWAFARWSIRRALGIGGDWRGKIGPLVLALVAFGPALVLIGLRAIFADTIDFNLITDQISFGAYAGLVGVDLLVFTVLVAPRLMCADRRDRVLPLYFATAATRTEYLAAKLLGAFIPIFVLAAAPVLTLFAGNVVFAAHPLGYLQGHLADIGRILVGGFLMALFWSAFGLAVASLTGRAAFAIAGFVALAIGSSGVANALAEVPSIGQDGLALDLVRVPVAMYDRQFPDGPLRDEAISFGAWSTVYVVTVALSLLVLWIRYRRVDA